MREIRTPGSVRGAALETSLIPRPAPDGFGSVKSPAEEAARIVESLPPEEAQALLEYALWLAERADGEEWDRRLGDPRYADFDRDFG